MAPVCVACHLSLPMLCMFVLLLSFVTLNVNSLPVYDRQALLELRLSAKELVKLDYTGHKTLPLLLSGIPAHLCHALIPPLWRKCPCHWNKCSGRLVRLKACLACFSSASLTENRVVPRLCISRHSLDPVNAWLVPVVSPDEKFQPYDPCAPHPHWHGVNMCNLRPLCWALRTVNAADPPVPVRIGLVNARSLVNKTFVLKDLFTSRGLDFLCVTETWLSVGESSTFTELLSHDCCYFKSLRTSG